MRPTAGIVLMFALAACSRPGGPPGASSEAAPAAMTEAPAPKAATSAPVWAVPPAASLPQLAYTYATQIEAPAAAVPRLMSRHEAACRSAGALVCQIVSAEQSIDGAEAHAVLTLRGEPGWLQRFRDGLPAETEAAKGKLIASTTKSEDLTRHIVDTEAALRAKTVLASRMEQLLANRQGKLSELVEIERSLAEIQGEIDAARSQLAVMRTRVATSELTLRYDSRPLAAGDSAWRPLGAAVRGSVRVFATMLAMLVTLAAGALPFAAVVALAFAGWRLSRRGRIRPAPKS